MERNSLRFGIVLGQRAPWPELVSRIKEVEARGYDDFNVVDHFYGLVDVMDPTHEAYTVLAALALYTERVRLGVMVCGNTYRNPAFLLKQAVTVDHISNGRVDFGVGAGWLEREHEAFGFAFPSARERVDMFAEALQLWDELQTNERTTYDGQFYQLLDTPFEPKSLQHTRLPVLIGASAPRMLRLTAQHADIWNARGNPAEAGAGNRALDRACADVGRDPAAISRSVSVGLQVWSSPESFADAITAYRAEGFTDFRIPWPRSATDYATFVRVSDEVIPALRAS